MKALVLFSAILSAAAHAAAPLRVTVVGQTLMRFDIRRAAPASAREVEPLLAPADVVFTNLEAAIAGPEAGKPTRGPDLLHAVNADVLDSLQAIGFNLLALGDNHSWDLGTGGILSTLAAADARHLAHAGTGIDLAGASAPGFLATPRGAVGLVAMASGKVGTDGAATLARPGVDELRIDEKTLRPNPEDTARILASVREAAMRSALVIVYEHNHDWADPMTATPSWMQGWARACIDAGAGLFVEHGEPLLHGIEIYHGRPIFYGLGNFIFQTRTQDKWNGPEIWQSVIASMEFSGGRVTRLQLAPLVLNPQGTPGPRWLETRGWPLPASGSEGRAILDRVERLSAPFGTRWRRTGEGRLAAILD